MAEEIVKAEKQSIGERFLNNVIRQVSTDGAKMEFTPSMKITASSYFVKIDSVLNESENKRDPKKNELEFAWKNVNMEKLARDVAHFSKLLLNPSIKNFMNPIPYKNNKTGKYDITFIVGYAGLEYVAKKYAFDTFVNGYCRLVYENDKFIPLPKSNENKVESFIHEISKPFDRGAIVGGFYYLEYENEMLNELRFFPLAEIEKRKPKNASSEFWGGEKTIWKDGKPAGVEKTDGWYIEMLDKTLRRMCFEKVAKDPLKIDEEFITFNTMLDKENEPPFSDYQEVKSEIQNGTAVEAVKFEEIKPEPVAEKPKKVTEKGQAEMNLEEQEAPY